MRILDVLERRIRPVAIPYLAPALVALQVVVYCWIAIMSPQSSAGAVDRLAMIPARVLEGEWWRPVTFLAVPPPTNPIFAIFAWMLFAMMGMALERTWGAARFNLFMLIGWVVTIAASFASPEQATVNGFLGLSVFLAFAAINPEFEIRLFLVLPVKVKWLAWISWALIGATVLLGGTASAIAALASVTNWFIFFGPDVLRRARHRRAASVKAAEARRPAAFHTCRVCGRTDLSDPELEFRYCDRCTGAPCYCMDHLRDHEHLVNDGQGVGRADARAGRAS